MKNRVKKIPSQTLTAGVLHDTWGIYGETFNGVWLMEGGFRSEQEAAECLYQSRKESTWDSAL